MRVAGPNEVATSFVFPREDRTLNQVDATNTTPGPFAQHTQFPYGRHGGFSVDELYVPLVLAGPAFKQGVLIPHPVEHPRGRGDGFSGRHGQAAASETAARVAPSRRRSPTIPARP